MSKNKKEIRGKFRKDVIVLCPCFYNGYVNPLSSKNKRFN